MAVHILKIITPLRLMALAIGIWAVVDHTEKAKLVEQGHELVPGGLGPLALFFMATITILVDAILSILLKARVNWKVQIVVILTLLLWI